MIEGFEEYLNLIMNSEVGSCTMKDSGPDLKVASSDIVRSNPVSNKHSSDVPPTAQKLPIKCRGGRLSLFNLS